MNYYDYGDAVLLTARIYDVNGSLVDPSTITCKVRDPAGNVTTPAVSSGGTGIRTATVSLTQEGAWAYRFESTGPVAAVEDTLFVRNSAFY